MKIYFFLKCQARLFPFPESKKQIDDKPDKRHRGDNPPQGFFARCAEIFLGHIYYGPDGG